MISELFWAASVAGLIVALVVLALFALGGFLVLVVPLALEGLRQSVFWIFPPKSSVAYATRSSMLLPLLGIEAHSDVYSRHPLPGSALVYVRFLLVGMTILAAALTPEWLSLLFSGPAYDQFSMFWLTVSYLAVAAGFVFFVLMARVAIADENDVAGSVPASARSSAEAAARAGYDHAGLPRPYFRLRFAAAAGLASALAVIVLHRWSVAIMGSLGESPFGGMRDVVVRFFEGLPYLGPAAAQAAGCLIDRALLAETDCQFFPTHREGLPGFVEFIGYLVGVTFAIALVFVLKKFLDSLSTAELLAGLERDIVSSEAEAHYDGDQSKQSARAAIEGLELERRSIYAERPADPEKRKDIDAKLSDARKRKAASEAEYRDFLRSRGRRRQDISRLRLRLSRFRDAAPLSILSAIARVEKTLLRTGAANARPRRAQQRLWQLSQVNRAAYSLSFLAQLRGLPRLAQRAGVSWLDSIQRAIQDTICDEWPVVTFDPQGVPDMGAIPLERAIQALNKFLDGVDPAAAPAHWAAFADWLAVLLTKLQDDSVGLAAAQAIERLKNALVVLENLRPSWVNDQDAAAIHYNMGMAYLVLARAHGLWSRDAEEGHFAIESAKCFEASIKDRVGAPAFNFAGSALPPTAQRTAAFAAALNGAGMAYAHFARLTMNELYGGKALAAFEEAEELWLGLSKSALGHPPFIAHNVAASRVHAGSIAAAFGWFRIAEEKFYSGSEGQGLPSAHIFNARIRRALALASASVRSAHGWLDAVAEGFEGQGAGRFELAMTYARTALLQIELIERKYRDEASRPLQSRLFLTGTRPLLTLLFLAKGAAFAALSLIQRTNQEQSLFAAALYTDFALRYDVETDPVAGSDGKVLGGPAIADAALTHTANALEWIDQIASEAPGGRLGLMGHEFSDEARRAWREEGGPTGVTQK